MNKEQLHRLLTLETHRNRGTDHWVLVATMCLSVRNKGTPSCSVLPTETQKQEVQAPRKRFPPPSNTRGKLRFQVTSETGRLRKHCGKLNWPTILVTLWLPRQMLRSCLVHCCCRSAQPLVDSLPPFALIASPSAAGTTAEQAIVDALSSEHSSVFCSHYLLWIDVCSFVSRLQFDAYETSLIYLLKQFFFEFIDPHLEMRVAKLRAIRITINSCMDMHLFLRRDGVYKYFEKRSPNYPTAPNWHTL